MLFAGTIAANIRLGAPAASDEAGAREAARLAHAAAFVETLPDGYDTVLGDGGAGVSAGQRQRIALARAFLRDAPILLLDEPTSNLDGDAEDEVLDAIRRLAAGRTVLLVAHRPSLLAMADRVVELRPARAALMRPARDRLGVAHQRRACRAVSYAQRAGASACRRPGPAGG